MLESNNLEERKDALNKAIASLPKRGQRVIHTMLDGHTQLETSRITSTPQSVVSYYLKTFRVRAAEELGENWA